MARPWEYEIDDQIIYVIGNEGKIASGELKRSVEKHLNREISTDVYSRHISELTGGKNSRRRRRRRYAINPVLDKEDHGRGKEIFYSFTHEARTRYRLKLPITQPELKREIAYQLLFMYVKNNYDIRSRLSQEDIDKYTFNTEDQFDSFLSEIHVRRDDLGVLKKPNIKKDEDEDDIREVKEHDGNTIYRYTNLVEPNKNIRIGKTEYPQKNKCNYICVLPGISAKDFVKETKKTDVLPLEHVQLTNSEVQEIFSILENEGLINKIRSQVLELLGEDNTRYEIADKRLRQFIYNCWLELFPGVHSRMMLVWKNSKAPKTKEEKQWYKTIWGSKKADIFFAKYHDSLKQTNKKLKTSGKQHDDAMKDKNEVNTHIKELDEFIPREFKRICNEYQDVIEKHLYPSKKLLELVYPPFLRELLHGTN